MNITIDTTAGTLEHDENGQKAVLALYSPEAFRILSRQWVRVEWSQKYSYSFAWLGRPVIQLPEDMIRVQEVIWSVQPDVIIETGVAHGGSLIYYASLCQLMGRGRVIGVDIEIRRENRKAIEAHPLASRITLVEGSSTDPVVVSAVKRMIKPDERVLAILDSCHTKQHVLNELEAYQELIQSGSYLVATDGIMWDLHDVPGGRPEWATDNPAAAAREFAAAHPEFVLEDPPLPFNESLLSARVTHWPHAWLRRR